MTIIQERLFAAPEHEITTDDYYTPKWVFDALAIRFDLDVCAPPGGIEWVPADRHYTIKDDGLTASWQGRVWMNPPYSNVTPWWDRMTEHRNGVALLPMAKSWWLNRVMSEADGVVISEQGGEMHFHRPGNPKPLRIWFPVFFAAFGDECVDAIANLGPVRVLR